MSSALMSLFVCLLCFSRGVEASTSVTIVTTSSTTTTTTKTEPMSPTDTPTQPAPQKCPSVTTESVSPAQKTGSVQEKFLNISVNPVTITEGSTGQLTINCTFWAMPAAEVARVGMIGLYRLRDVKSSFGLDKQEVATAAGGAKNEPVAKENLKITRHVNNSGLSYLNLTITAPTSKDEGLYRCTVVGADTHKEPFMAQAVMGVGPHGADKPTPTSSLETASSGAASAKLRQQAETVQLALNDIAKKVADLEKFQTNAYTRLANIKDSVAQLNVTFENAQYFISTVEVSDFKTAQATCELFGGFLAEAENFEELQLFTSFAAGIFGVKGEDSRFGEVDGVLIGGTYDEDERKWVTRFNVDNSPYFQWRDGYPTTDPTKKCVVLLRDADWGMTNQACSSENSNTRFMCEIPNRK